MNRQAKDFLMGFQHAALLTQEVRSRTPGYATAAVYLETVARLFAGSSDLVGRGLAAGCLSALGRA